MLPTVNKHRVTKPKKVAQATNKGSKGTEVPRPRIDRWFGSNKGFNDLLGLAFAAAQIRTVSFQVTDPHHEITPGKAERANAHKFNGQSDKGAKVQERNNHW